VNKELAIVTGAGSGIGRACALALGSRGFAVAAIDLDEKSARDTASQITGARAYRADVSVSAQVDAAVSAAVADLGPIEVLVNNAGILDGYFNAEEMDEALWRKVIDVDLTGVFLVSKRALRDMLPRARGCINMASVAGLNGTGGGAAYIAAKHGVVGLTRQMAVAYGARGIRVNCVCPGAIPTGLRPHSQAILGPGVPDMSNRGVRRPGTLARSARGTRHGGGHRRRSLLPRIAGGFVYQRP
jgi:NAD(P)-dependent dehydrogenase (short-subunit alcohol dehydrogenase family)